MKILVTDSHSSESIFASSFNRALKHIDEVPCCFITAFRKYNYDGSPLSNKDKKYLNKLLEQDIKESGLSFFKVSGSYMEDTGEGVEQVDEDTFMIIDNLYSPGDFKEFCFYLCGKYDQDSVLITNPVIDRNANSDHTLAASYDRYGNIVHGPFENISMHDIDEFFTSICGKDFVMSSTSEVRTRGRDIYTRSSRIVASGDFERKYPELSIKSKDRLANAIRSSRIK